MPLDAFPQRPTTRSNGRHLRQVSLKAVLGLPTQIVNDKGRYRSQPLSRVEEVVQKRACGKRRPIPRGKLLRARSPLSDSHESGPTCVEGESRVKRSSSAPP